MRAGPGCHPLRRVRAARIDVQRVQRLAGGHEEPIALGTAEADVRAPFRQPNLADARAVGCKDVYPVIARTGPARRGPDVAVDVDAHAVWTDRDAIHAHVGELSAIRHARPIQNVKYLDVAR